MNWKKVKFKCGDPNEMYWDKKNLIQKGKTNLLNVFGDTFLVYIIYDYWNVRSKSSF